MRLSVPFVLTLLSACAPDGQTATIGDCPEGSTLNDSGECEEEIGSFSNDEEGDVNGEDGDEDDPENGDEADDDTDEPVDLPPLEADVDGWTYALDLGSAEWVQPDSSIFEGLIGDSLDIQILVGVKDVTNTTLDLVGALPDTDSDSLVQDTCLPTLDFESIDFSDSPAFRAGPTDFPVEFSGINLNIISMEISGIFEPDGESMYDVGVSGALDLRDILPALGESDFELPIDLSDVDQICEYAMFLSIACQACPTDGEEYCVEVALEEIEAEKVSADIVIISEDDIDSEECE